MAVIVTKRTQEIHTLGEESGDGEKTLCEREVLRELAMRALDHD